jgi:hypothetical protein
VHRKGAKVAKIGRKEKELEHRFRRFTQIPAADLFSLTPKNPGNPCPNSVFSILLFAPALGGLRAFAVKNLFLISAYSSTL